MYTSGMPEDVFEDSLHGRVSDPSRPSSGNRGPGDQSKSKKEDSKKKTNGLSESQRDRFEDMLRYDFFQWKCLVSFPSESDLFLCPSQRLEASRRVYFSSSNSNSSSVIFSAIC